MLWVILLYTIKALYCNCIRHKSHLFVNRPFTHTHYRNTPVNLFEKEEIEAVNPCVPIIPKKRPIYDHTDPLSELRIDNFYITKDSPALNLSSLPYAQIEHQDKNKLVRFEDGREILSFYANKLNSFLANFMEWNKAYDPDPNNFDKLELYNPIAPNTYYAVVYYCSWQSESIALVKAIKQLLGNYYFKRDPPVVHEKKRMMKKKEIYAEFRKAQAIILEYKKQLEHAKLHNLPLPEDPLTKEREQVVFHLDIPDVEETFKILEYCRKKYDFNWWMPNFGKIKYNRTVDKAFNELYNTSYKLVRSSEDRKKYKLEDTKRIIRPKQRKMSRPINLNFVLVRLANSMMISNSTQGVRRHRRFIQSHEKEYKFNEIMLRLLVEQKIYYENMPAMQLFKCKESLDMVPPVFGTKTHEFKPFSKYSTFYKPNPFEIAGGVNYGLPTLRKCNHLSISEDFVHLGNFMDLSRLKTIDSFDNLFTPESDFLSLLTKTRDMSREDMGVVEPVLQTLSLMYKYHLKKIIDARPKKTEYLVLNPKI